MCEAVVFVYDFDRFHADDILPMFKKYNVTSFCAPPTMYRFFIKEDLSKYDLSSLKYACIAGEAFNPEVFHQFYKATGIKLMEGFGQTEYKCRNVFNAPNTHQYDYIMERPAIKLISSLSGADPVLLYR